MPSPHVPPETMVSLQDVVQKSVLIEFPSSHCSPASTILSPQRAFVQLVRQLFAMSRFCTPSSHCSPGCFTPSPHRLFPIDPDVEPPLLELLEEDDFEDELLDEPPEELDDKDEDADVDLDDCDEPPEELEEAVDLDDCDEPPDEEEDDDRDDCEDPPPEDEDDVPREL